MTADELKLENQRIFFECEGKIETLYKKYADEHNPVKVGDIIKSGGEMLRVDKIYYERIHGRFLLRDDDCPICMEYLCTPLYKDGTPKKRAVPYFVSQRHVKMINGEPYKYKEL
jgi:hypothetical protein